jgi:dynein heavy chain
MFVGGMPLQSHPFDVGKGDHSWGFAGAEKELFGKTKYMHAICSEILEIIDALDYFKKLLGPELKSVTGDSAGIGMFARLSLSSVSKCYVV